jgi:hypothetical protein
LGAFAAIRRKIEGGTAVKRTVPVAEVATVSQDLSARVEDALGELVGAAKEGLLALSVGVGLGVLSELMEEEVDDVVGPKGKHDRDRTAVREPGAVRQLCSAAQKRASRALRALDLLRILE